MKRKSRKTTQQVSPIQKEKEGKKNQKEVPHAEQQEPSCVKYSKKKGW
jgi:hypothetical protein